MMVYCEQDVNLLLAGLEAYHAYQTEGRPGFKVFTSLTVSALANRLLRGFFMKPNSLSHPIRPSCEWLTIG